LHLCTKLSKNFDQVRRRRCSDVAPPGQERALESSCKEIRLRAYMGEEFEARAKIEEIDGYSAHADEGELLDFIAAIPNKPERVFVVHGEPDAANAMAIGLSKLGIKNVIVPKRGDRFEV
jgi:metallo-beta-lactamase family protein